MPITTPMAIGYVQILSVILCFCLLCLWKHKKHEPVRNWPIIGMLPGILSNAHRIHDYATQVLKQSGCTYEVKGPWFANMNMVITSDPANVRHVTSKNFSNFPQGSQFKKIFEVLGDGIFTSDSDMWMSQRRIAHLLLKDGNFIQLLDKTTWRLVHKELIPVLDHVSEIGREVDMQDLLQRLTFDITSRLILGSDPGCLSVDLPEVPLAKAFREMEEAALHRYTVPEILWRLKKWLQIGDEKKMSRANKNMDHFITKCILSQKEQLQQTGFKMAEAGNDFNLLMAYMKEQESTDFAKSDKFLRDTAFNFMAAGTDTIAAALTWFIWVLATNPAAEKKILDEIKANLLVTETKWSCFSAEELNRLVYLHGALCETLRLFPPVPITQKVAAQRDILPSGQQINSNEMVLVMIYAMGRMEEVWGKDCLEFKPERWVLAGGGIKHEPSYKFMTFNSGPRSCIGKEISFRQMKAIATMIIYNYHVELVEGHPVNPSNSMILHMQHGLNARSTEVMGQCTGLENLGLQRPAAAGETERETFICRKFYSSSWIYSTRTLQHTSKNCT